jgi:hypothetical protein
VIKETEDGQWQRTGQPVRIVTKESATWFMSEEDVHNQISVNSDHSNLVKFTSRIDENYLAVSSKMRDMVKKAPEIARLRGANSK